MYLFAKFNGHNGNGDGDIKSYINSYKNTLKKT